MITYLISLSSGTLLYGPDTEFPFLSPLEGQWVALILYDTQYYADYPCTQMVTQVNRWDKTLCGIARSRS